MRWGNWYRHSDDELIHRTAGTLVPMTALDTPAHVVEVVLRLGESITAADAAHLLIAANELCWEAWSFDGLGDWCDGSGRQRGEGARVALGCTTGAA